MRARHACAYACTHAHVHPCACAPVRIGAHPHPSTCDHMYVHYRWDGTKFFDDFATFENVHNEDANITRAAVVGR